MQVVALDTSVPMATNCCCGDVLGLRPGRKERNKGPPPRVVCCTATASSPTCRAGWGFARLDCLSAKPSSLGTPPTFGVTATVCMWRSNR